MSNIAYNYLIKILSARDYSEHKLREKCKNRGYSQEETDLAINEIKDNNYLREDLYIEARIKAFMNKGYSAYYIQQKLKEEHLKIDSESIEEVFTENKMSDTDQIKNLIRKKVRSEINEAQILRFLLGKGHNYTTSKKALKEFIQENNRE